MADTLSGHVRVTLQILADHFNDLSWDFQFFGMDSPNYEVHGCRVFSETDEPMDPTTLYIIPAEAAERFPANEYQYITPCPLDGSAPHISHIDRSVYEILNETLSVFQIHRDFEQELNDILSCGGSLNELCEAGCRFFNNPLYVHDNLFTILALPRYEEGMLNFEKNQESGEMHIPLWLVNDFKFDEDYQKTLEMHEAAIWGKDQYPHNFRSLYVNIWDGDYYFGRVLINEIDTALKPGQATAAEAFATYVLRILKRDIATKNSYYRDYSELIRNLLLSRPYEKSQLSRFLETLSWKESDRFIVLLFESQDKSISIRSDSALRNRLASLLNSSFSFFHEQRLCVIVNIAVSNLRKAILHQYIAPLVRDSYMYCGISSLVYGVHSLSTAYRQAEAALYYLRGEEGRWLNTFENSALDYLRDSTKMDIPHENFIPDNLSRIRLMDKENGTQFYKTLKYYIVNERDIPKTAAALFVHRTTLVYRLERMKEMLAMNLDDPDVRLYLLLSFRMVDEE